MVGEPTTFPKAWFDAFPDAVDAAPLLAEPARVKTEQELERMRLANEIAAAAMEHVQGVLRPGMSEAQAAAEWEGFVHGEGTGWRGRVELALGFSLVWSGPGIKTFTATDDRPIVGGRADVVRDLGLRRRLLVRPHEEPRRRGAHGRISGSSRRVARRLRGTPCPLPAGREPRRARPASPRGDRAARLSRAAVAPDLRTVWVPAPTSRRTRTRPAAARCTREWCLQSNQDVIETGEGASASRTTS